MECPQGWKCNEECAHYLGIDKCDYVEETVDLKEIAVKIEQETARKARSAAEKLMAKSGDSFFKEFYSYRASNLMEKESYKSMSGAIVLGGGSKSGKRAKKPVKKGDKLGLVLDV